MFSSASWFVNHLYLTILFTGNWIDTIILKGRRVESLQLPVTRNTYLKELGMKKRQVHPYI